MIFFSKKKVFFRNFFCFWFLAERDSFIAFYLDICDCVQRITWSCRSSTWHWKEILFHWTMATWLRKSNDTRTATHRTEQLPHGVHTAYNRIRWWKWNSIGCCDKISEFLWNDLGIRVKLRIPHAHLFIKNSRVQMFVMRELWLMIHRQWQCAGCRPSRNFRCGAMRKRPNAMPIESEIRWVAHKLTNVDNRLWNS